MYVPYVSFWIMSNEREYLILPVICRIYFWCFNLFFVSFHFFSHGNFLVADLKPFTLQLFCVLLNFAKCDVITFLLIFWLFNFGFFLFLHALRNILFMPSFNLPTCNFLYFIPLLWNVCPLLSLYYMLNLSQK